jgi:cytochrome c5
MKALIVSLVVLASAAAAAQKPATPGAQDTKGTQVRNATGGAIQDRSSQSPAEALFVEKCGMCHREMGMGTVILARRMDPARAMLEKRDGLPSDLVVSVTRKGVGNMPRISRGEVSDAELKVIADYLGKVTR